MDRAPGTDLKEEKTPPTSLSPLVQPVQQLQGKENGKPNLDEFGRAILKRSRSPLDQPSDGAEEPPRKRHKPSPERQSWDDRGNSRGSRRSSSSRSKSAERRDEMDRDDDSDSSGDDRTGRFFGNQIDKSDEERKAEGREKLLKLEHGQTLEEVFCQKKPGSDKPWAPFGLAAKPCQVAAWRTLMEVSNDFDGLRELDYWKYIEAVADRTGLYVLYVVKYLFEVRDRRLREQKEELDYLDEPRPISSDDLEWQYQVINCVVNYGDERGWGWTQPKNVFISKFVAEFDPELIIYTMKKIREFNPDTFDKLAAHYIDKVVDDSDSFLRFIMELTKDAPSVVEVGSLIMQAYKGASGVFQYFKEHYRDAEDSGEIDDMFDLKDQNDDGGPQPQEGDSCLAVWRYGDAPPNGDTDEKGEANEPQHMWKPAVVETIDKSRYYVDFDAECYPPPKKKKKGEYSEPVDRFLILRKREHVKWRDDHPKFEPTVRWDELSFPSIFLWRVAKAKGMTVEQRTKFVAFITREWNRGEMKSYVDPLKEIMDVENEDFTAVVPMGVMFKPVDVDFDKQGVCC